MNFRFIKISLLIFTIIGGLAFSLQKTATKKTKDRQGKVVIKKEKNNYVLYRNGEPYYIKGAGGLTNYEKLKQCGGNSVRIWSTEGAKEYLDKAQSLGLTVTLGLDMSHERLGYNYDDKKAVAEQFERLKKDILTFKDHPALLMWGVGNEVEQFAKNYNVWDAVNNIAKFIHEVDSNHPTTTMLAGVPTKHIKELIKRCPDIDILSINAFRWITPVKDDITRAGWRGPYLIGEWGASGYWELDTVPWGAFLEQTSTEKARVCAEKYQTAILPNINRCVGSYIFYWGYKQARTHTLLSLILEKGEETGIIDVLCKEWTGKSRPNIAPSIVPIGIDDQPTHKGIYVKPSTNHMAFTDAKDPDNDQLIYSWEIFHESREKKEGGDKENKPLAVEGLIINGKTKQLSFKAPEKEGPYRLFVTVSDGNNHVATANAPFYVKK